MQETWMSAGDPGELHIGVPAGETASISKDIKSLALVDGKLYLKRQSGLVLIVK